MKLFRRKEDPIIEVKTTQDDLDSMYKAKYDKSVKMIEDVEEKLKRMRRSGKDARNMRRILYHEGYDKDFADKAVEIFIGQGTILKSIKPWTPKENHS